ncbi:MAG: enolase C-terminal domain-like protein [Singulisphaera sp.]
MTGVIERVTLTHLQIPLKEPFRISAGEVAIKDAILVSLATSDGEGVGESSPMAAGFGYSTDTPEGCWDDLADRIAPGLVGRSFATVEEIADLAGSWSGSRFAVAGAETACWDLLGHARHESLAEMLGASGDAVLRGVDSGLAVGLYPTIVDLIQAIDTHMAEGYRRVKIKITPGSDVDLVRAVRQHFGDVPLMVDANASYTIADLDVFRELDGYDLLMFEQPMAADDLDGLAALQKVVTTPVCIDETAETPGEDARGDPTRACRIVNIKLQRGGVRPRAGDPRPLPREWGRLLGGDHARAGRRAAQGIHLAALANCKYPTDIEPGALVRRRLRDPAHRDGPARPPGRPDAAGLGYQVDPAKVRRYAVRHAEFTSKTVG